MQQAARAHHLASLHVKGHPLVLYNAWDAGTAKAIAAAGAPALATSSWAVAAAHGYEDGEAIPFAFVERIVARIAAVAEVPLTVDIEGGYSDDPQVCAQHVARLIDCGVVGINIEDRIVGGSGLHDIDAQSARIAAIRSMAEGCGVPLFINARTDICFGTGGQPPAGLDQVRQRAAAYAAAGASGLFVPGLVDLDAIASLAGSIALPLNVMAVAGMADARALAGAGVARISFGAGPYRRAMEALQQASQAAFA